MIVRHHARLLLASMLVIAAAAGQAQVFYTITTPGGKHNWLLGTLHSDDPRLLGFPPVLEQALREARVVALELAPEPETLAVLERRMLLPDGETLADRIDPALHRRVVAALRARGVPEPRARRLRPWAAAMTLAQPPLADGRFMDLVLARQAAAAGARVTGLETVDEQSAFFIGLGEAAHRRLLEDAVAAIERGDNDFEPLMEAYLDGDPERLLAMTRARLEVLGPALAERFVEHGIIRRNRQMVERAAPWLQRGGTLIAVGALHLPGEYGLVALLQELGYCVEPVY